jgi:5-methyltetrahydropteroyltriglutamate--homocysteine methyltransferase
VGSLLRPSGLLQARVDFTAGRLDRAGLRAEEDRAILQVLRRQRDCGLDVHTDGEFRRSGFAAGFLAAVEGFVASEPGASARRGGGTEERAGWSCVVAARLRPRGRIAEEEAAFLRQHAGGPFKVTLPGALLFAQFAYRPQVSDRAYRSREDLIADAGAILAEEAGALAAEGVPYLQVDAPGYARLADPALLARDREEDVDPDRLLDAAIAADNRVLDAARRGGALAAVHLCLGSAGDRRLADRVAERLFTGLSGDRLLLGYDSPETADFRPLRFVPARMVVTLGLISQATGELERRDDLLRRIDQASRIVPLEQLALAPRCGFASSQVGSPLTEDQQWRKLQLVAELAREVWP